MSHLPAVRDSMLFTTPHEAPVQVETEHWFDWLREARSFTFAGIAGPFTARHEERSGRHFWYAYRQQDGVLHKTYLGRSPELTLQRLEQAAQALANAGSKRTRDDSSGEWVSPLICAFLQRKPQVSCVRPCMSRCSPTAWPRLSSEPKAG